MVFNKSEQFHVAVCYAILRWNLVIEMFVWIGHIAGVNKLPAPGRCWRLNFVWWRLVSVGLVCVENSCHSSGPQNFEVALRFLT